MLKTVCRYLFLSSSNREQILGTILKKSFNFEQGQRKYATTWGGAGRARGQKSL